MVSGKRGASGASGPTPIRWRSATATTTLAPVPGPRRRRSESPDETLARYRASGLTQRAFCEQVGLPLSTLQWWLLRARRRAVARRPVTVTELALPIAPLPRAPAWAPYDQWGHDRPCV
jgi:hypothetical protein